MKIFISWSGEVSHRVAMILRDWLRDILPGIDPFVSSEDLRKGRPWGAGLAKELSETSFGIACLTSSNLVAPWLNFEAGALSKALEESQVCTLLLGGLKYTDVTGPLQVFQHTVFKRDDVRKLVGNINDKLSSGKREPESLDRVFAKFWPDLEVSVEAATGSSESSPNQIATRPSEEMLIELVERTRAIEKALPDFASLKDHLAHNLATDRGSAASPVNEGPEIFTLWKNCREHIAKDRPRIVPLMKDGQLLVIVHEYVVVYFHENYKSFEVLHKAHSSYISRILSEIWGKPLIFLPLAGDVPF